MSVEFVTGDLFDPSWDFDAVGHGVNALGVMGKGIAVEFKRRWPSMFHNYARLCRAGGLQPGQVLPWQVTGRPRMVYNLCTQAGVGRIGGSPAASPQALEEAVREMMVHATVGGYRKIGLPRLGAGLGGLPWGVVRALLEKLGSSSTLQLFVFEGFRTLDIYGEPEIDRAQEA